MNDFIDPSDAPMDGQRVVFFVPDETGTEQMISAVFKNGFWRTIEGNEFNPLTAKSASVVGHDL